MVGMQPQESVQRHFSLSHACPSPPCPTHCSLLHIAKGGTWIPSTHHLWPHTFKAATRTCLLAAQSSAAHHSDSTRACGLGSLPTDVLLHILSIAALPMSAWL